MASEGRSIRVRTPNAPPTAPQNLRFETLKETSIFIRWDEPALLHGGGLIDYEVSYNILAIGDVRLGRRERDGGGSLAMRRKEKRFYDELARKYHGDRRLSGEGVAVGRLWSLVRAHRQIHTHTHTHTHTHFTHTHFTHTSSRTTTTTSTTIATATAVAATTTTTATLTIITTTTMIALMTTTTTTTTTTTAACHLIPNP